MANQIAGKLEDKGIASSIFDDMVGIAKSLEALGVKREDFPTLADNSMKDVRGFTNPVKGTAEDIIGIFAAAYGPR